MAEGGEGSDGQDRTEAPTPRRLEQARQEGQVAVSREATGFAALLLATLSAATLLPMQGTELMRALRGALAGAHAVPMDAAMAELAWRSLLAVASVGGAAALGAVAMTLVQTRGLVSAKSLVPKLSKLSPLAGLKRLFGMEALAELLRTVLKLLLIGAALWHALGDWAAFQAVLHRPAGALLHEVGRGALRLAGAALVAFAAVALIDFAWVHWRHLRRLRMSREDLKREMRDTEGDPHLKARLKQLRQQRSRRRMLAEVPKAAVVVTNPTHYAVALAYAPEESQAAPKVVAKGVDAIAARIREAAEAHRVPIVANPPLARALYTLDLDSEIAPEHYQAVAEVIAYVWRLQGKRTG